MSSPYGPNAPWMPPAGAPPGYVPQSAGEGPLAKRLHTLGTTSLTLGILELVYAGFKLLNAAITGPLLAVQKSLLGGAPAASPLPSMMKGAEDFASRIAVWEAVRALPFAIASGFLIGIALRLRRGERAALFSARTWVWCALGVIALSVALQVLVVVPATLEYQRTLMSALPTIPSGAGTPLNIGQVVDTWMVVSMVLSLLFSTVFFACWPITLRLWADRLIRDTESSAA